MLNALYIGLMVIAAGDPNPAAQTTPATPAAQQAVQAPGQSQASTQIAQRHAVQCHKDFVTGSRLPTYVCGSQADATDLEHDSRDVLNRMQVLRDGQSQQ